MHHSAAFASFLPTYRAGWRGASAILLACSLLACTEDTINPTFAAPVVKDFPNDGARDFNDYTVLKWSDEFDDSRLNQGKWTYEVQDTWYNDEKQATTSSSDNLYLSGGNLVIQALRQSYHGKEYTSARIKSAGKKNFGFGRIDIRAKMPRGQGLWPAIWMLGANDATVPWPKCGEIDISEVRGSNPTVNVSTVHYGNSYEARQSKGLEYTIGGASLADDFHLYSVVRSRDLIRWYVDSTEYFRVSPTEVTPYPFNDPFYMILNVAVGGNFGGDPDANTVFPQQMTVDYVRFLQYPE